MVVKFVTVKAEFVKSLDGFEALLDAYVVFLDELPLIE